MTAKENRNLKIAGASAVSLLALWLITKPKTEKGNTPYDPVTNPNGAQGFNAKNVAAGLLKAMATMGTDEQAIFDILTFVNAAQFKEVVKAFGSHQYNSTTGNQINYFPVYQLPYVSLKGWLASELSKENYASLRSKYPNSL